MHNVLIKVSYSNYLDCDKTLNFVAESVTKQCNSLQGKYQQIFIVDSSQQAIYLQSYPKL